MKSPSTPDKITSAQFSKFLPEYVEYAERIRKSLYYGRLPSTDRPSLPFTNLSVERFRELCRQEGLEQLDARYAAAVCHEACVTPCCLILALVYLDRLRGSNPDYLTCTPPSRVFLVAMMVASKYLYDDGQEDEVFNDEWATSASLPLTELNQAERDFLDAIDWNLFVDNDAFLCAFERVEAEVAWREGGVRRGGQFTYSDLLALTHTLPPAACSLLLNLVSQVVVVCVVGYTAAVVSVVASTVLAHHLTWAVRDLVLDPTPSSPTQLGLNHSLLPVSGEQPALLETPVLPVLLESLAGQHQENLAEDLLPGVCSSLPSPALTTLTTSILLAISSPSSPRRPPHCQPRFRSKTRRSQPCMASSGDEERLDESTGSTHSGMSTSLPYEQDLGFDPTDLRLSFTTGPFWPPSSQMRQWDEDGRLPSSLLHPPSMNLALEVQQKGDWVYSNPWVIPWLSWHSAPVYSLVRNGSGVIGAPNLTGVGRHSEQDWPDWMTWAMAVLAELTGDLAEDRPGGLHRLGPITVSPQPAPAPLLVPWLM